MPGISIGGGRTATPSDLTGAWALLEVLADPARSRSVLEELRNAQEAHDASLASAAAKIAEVERLGAEVTSQQEKLASVERTLRAFSAELEHREAKITQDEAEAQDKWNERNGELQNRVADLDARESTLHELELEIDHRSRDLDTREKAFMVRVRAKEAELDNLINRAKEELAVAESARIRAEDRLEAIRSAAEG